MKLDLEKNVQETIEQEDLQEIFNTSLHVKRPTKEGLLNIF